MNQYKSSSELKNIAREKLSGKYGPAMLVSPVLGCLLTLAVVLPLLMFIIVPLIIINIITQSTLNEPLLFIAICVIIFLSAIFMGVLNTGTSLFYLNIACGKRYSVSNIFFGYRWQFKKSLALSAVMVLLNLLFMLPYYIFSFLDTYFYEPQWSLLASVSYLVGLVLFYPVQLALSQCFYLLLDFPHYSTVKLLKLSNQIMKGHKRRLFYILLSFLPLELLSIFSFFIGYLWLTPYRNMTYALFFLDLMKPKQAATYDPFTN